MRVRAGQAAALDHGLSQHTLIAVSGRPRRYRGDEISRCLAALAHSGLQALDETTVRGGPPRQV
jgi:hypothetical protein